MVAMADPADLLAVDDIAIMTGLEVRVGVAAPEDITAVISRLNRHEDPEGGTLANAGCRTQVSGTAMDGCTVRTPAA
jgi:type IV pilus assembly protein PilB